MFPVFDILNVILLGIIEAATEFLPISSTGHLILANEFINFSSQISKEFIKTFDVVIQLGAILAVIVFYRKKFIPDNKNILLWKKIVLAVIPALFLGFLLNDFIESALFNPHTVAIALIIGGIIILFVENKTMSDKITDLEKIDYKTAIKIGFIQCLAMIPGTSRSAATIIGARLLGSSRMIAAEFSFFLAVPTMIAASGYTLLKNGWQMTGFELIILSIGFVVSFILALLVIKLFLKYISNHDFKLFGYYRIILGIIVLIYFL